MENNVTLKKVPSSFKCSQDTDGTIIHTLDSTNGLSYNLNPSWAIGALPEDMEKALNSTQITVLNELANSKLITDNSQVKAKGYELSYQTQLATASANAILRYLQESKVADQQRFNAACNKIAESNKWNSKFLITLTGINILGFIGVFANLALSSATFNDSNP